MKIKRDLLSLSPSIGEPATEIADKAPVTIVVPCFNEELTLPHLRSTLSDVREHLGKKYELYFLIADDGSTDSTWPTMVNLFGGQSNCTLVRQSKNLGVAATILNGIRRAKTEIVCSIDCDCTYDPHELGNLVPMLTSDVDLVTASPYHPHGMVLDVPRWRRALSKSASSLYRLVLRQKLYTYTSCFRVYRRSAILNLNLQKGGFIGVAELLGKLDLQGSKIVECPARLEARAHGTSKMNSNIMQVTAGHIYLLSYLWAMRAKQKFFGTRPPEAKLVKAAEK